MLTHTFCHIEGVGPRTEQRIWTAGCCSWEDVETGSAPVSPRKLERFRRAIADSAEALRLQQAGFFSGRLPSAEQWRLFSHFGQSAAFLDIETTGLDEFQSSITTIAVFAEGAVRHYVRGINLEQFPGDIQKYPLLVTYNGKSFDVPFIRREFGIPMEQAHIDLRFVLAALGFRGGLKRCEQSLGIGREGLEAVDGFFAVLLWSDYIRHGNERALETLLAYNIADAVNLSSLMTKAYNLKIRGLPLASLCELAPVPVPVCHLKPDAATIARLQATRNGQWGSWA